MGSDDDLRGAAATARLARRIRVRCVRRGWDFGELARRAGLSRTTLFTLETGRTQRPRAATLSRIAAALETTIDELIGNDRPSAIESNLPSDDARRTFDRSTNAAVSTVRSDRPELFGGWNDADWDELGSAFGVGGALTETGVATVAEGIDRRRDTVRRLHVVLETHLAEVAEELVDALYRQVRPPPNLAPTLELTELVARTRDVDP